MRNPFRSQHARQIDSDLAAIRAGRRSESTRLRQQVDAEVAALRKAAPKVEPSRRPDSRLVREAQSFLTSAPRGAMPGSVAAGGPRRPIGPGDKRQAGQSRGLERRGFGIVRPEGETR
jgi:hypothetical protein